MMSFKSTHSLTAHCTDYIAHMPTHSHPFECHDHLFQRKADCWATNTKSQWLHIDCSWDQYRATLISHSQREHHNTLSIPFSPSYSAISSSKHNSSSAKRQFHAWIHPDAFYKYVLSTSMFWHLPIWTQCWSLLISGKVITTARVKFSAPGVFIPLVCTAHSPPHALDRTARSYRNCPQPIATRDLDLPILSHSNQFINYILFCRLTSPMPHRYQLHYTAIRLDYLVQPSLWQLLSHSSGKMMLTVSQTHCSNCLS